MLERAKNSTKLKRPANILLLYHFSNYYCKYLVQGELNANEKCILGRLADCKDICFSKLHCFRGPWTRGHRL